KFKISDPESIKDSLALYSILAGFDRPAVADLPTLACVIIGSNASQSAKRKALTRLLELAGAVGDANKFQTYLRQSQKPEPPEKQKDVHPLPSLQEELRDISRGYLTQLQNGELFEGLHLENYLRYFSAQVEKAVNDAPTGHPAGIFILGPVFLKSLD